MGGSSSRPPPPSVTPVASPSPRPSPFTSTPWRTTPAWIEDSELSLRKQIKEIQPQFKPTIVLVGPVGAGKSSFVNAILSVARGHQSGDAYTEKGSKSCTKSYDMYTEKSLLQKFRLNDCMGLEQSEEEGFNVADMVSLLKGHVKDGYTFNPISPISQGNKDWRVNPKFEHQTHCVVFVVDSNVIDTGIPPTFVKKIRELQVEVKRLRVPRVLILTKCDVLCPEVQADITKMYQSVRIRETVKKACEVFRIPEVSIHPVTNYEDSDAVEISWQRNIPILIALRQITQYANDRIDAMNEHSDSD